MGVPLFHQTSIKNWLFRVPGSNIRIIICNKYTCKIAASRLYMLFKISEYSGNAMAFFGNPQFLLDWKKSGETPRSPAKHHRLPCGLWRNSSLVGFLAPVELVEPWTVDCVTQLLWPWPSSEITSLTWLPRRFCPHNRITVF